MFRGAQPDQTSAWVSSLYTKTIIFSLEDLMSVGLIFRSRRIRLGSSSRDFLGAKSVTWLLLTQSSGHQIVNRLTLVTTWIKLSSKSFQQPRRFSRQSVGESHHGTSPSVLTRWTQTSARNNTLSSVQCLESMAK